MPFENVVVFANAGKVFANVTLGGFLDTGGYLKWLLGIKGLKRATCQSRISNCLKIEKFEGDLDEAYDNDRMASLLDRLTYSVEDERTKAPARHSVPMSGNVRRGTATLKSAAVLYRDFRDTQHLDVLSAMDKDDPSAEHASQILWGSTFMQRYAAQLENLHSDRLFGLVVAEVERQSCGARPAECQAVIVSVFSSCTPERRFPELQQILEDVVGSGFREGTAYVSVYNAMKVLDFAHKRMG